MVRTIVIPSTPLDVGFLLTLEISRRFVNEIHDNKVKIPKLVFISVTILVTTVSSTSAALRPTSTANGHLRRNLQPITSSPFKASNALNVSDSVSKLTEAKPSGLKEAQSYSHFPYFQKRTYKCSRVISLLISPT
ncbi:unnamed protein product [Orchesella dallaii]|uniref:Uncharacterized protein n=1 Tax=Orchesella dallaii TaxID=48710 RepID=A0ABP1QJT8_9HEXA